MSRHLPRFLLCVLSLPWLAFGATEQGETFSSVERESTPLAGLDIQYTPILYKNLVFTKGGQVEKGGNALHVALEWLPVTSAGKIGLGLGTGFFALPNLDLGGDRFVSFYTIPAEFFLSYRLDYMKNQILVPFVKIGTSAVFFKASSKTGVEVSSQIQTYYGFDTVVGLEICLNRVDASGAKAMENNFGVDNTYFIAEYLRSQHIGESHGRPNLSREEYRFGLRFEL